MRSSFHLDLQVHHQICPIIVDVQSVEAIRLFAMIDYEILTDSQHYCDLTFLTGGWGGGHKGSTLIASTCCGNLPSHFKL